MTNLVGDYQSRRSFLKTVTAAAFAAMVPKYLQQADQGDDIFSQFRMIVHFGDTFLIETPVTSVDVTRTERTATIKFSGTLTEIGNVPQPPSQLTVLLPDGKILTAKSLPSEPAWADVVKIPLNYSLFIYGCSQTSEIGLEDFQRFAGILNARSKNV